MSRSLRHLCVQQQRTHYGPSNLGAVRSISASARRGVPDALFEEASKGGQVGIDVPALLRDSMARSPIRRCILTKQHLPSDYMVRFIPALDPSSPSDRPQLLLTPRTAVPRQPEPQNGVRIRKGVWISCRRDAVEVLSTPGRHVGSVGLGHIPNLKIPPDLVDQVQVQLRQRVKYELELLKRRGSAPSAGGREQGDLGKEAGQVPLGEISESELEAVLRGESASSEEDGRPAAILAILDIGADKTRSIGTSASRHSLISTPPHFPILPLVHHFPGSEHHDLHEALADALPTPTMTSHQHSPSPERPYSPYPRSSLVAVQGRPEMGKEGLAGIPLIKALLRLRMWSGDGWVEPEEV